MREVAWALRALATVLRRAGTPRYALRRLEERAFRGLPALEDGERCDGCGACAAACPLGWLQVEGAGRVIVIWQRCMCCGLCVAACPAGSLGLRPEVEVGSGEGGG